MGKGNENSEKKDWKNLNDATNKVNRMFELLGLKKGRGYRVGSNDIMNLRKVYTEYTAAIEKFKTATNDALSKWTYCNSYVQRYDVRSRIEDTKDNIKAIDEAILKGIYSSDADYDSLFTKLNSSLSKKDKKTKAGINLIETLKEYSECMKSLKKLKTDHEGNIDVSRINDEDRKNIVETRQKLLDCCLKYMKEKTLSGYKAYAAIDDITEALSKEGEESFERLTDENFREFNARRHIPCLKPGAAEIMIIHIYGDDFVYDFAEKREEIRSKGNKIYDKGIQDAINNYFKELYYKDRGIEIGATDQENKERLERFEYIQSKFFVWNIRPFDAYTKDKETFKAHQENDRKINGDKYSILADGEFKKRIENFAPDVAKERESVGNTLYFLEGSEFNGFFRKLKNSPEYTTLLNSLKDYVTDKKDDTIESIAQKRKTAMEACDAYIARAEEKKLDNKIYSDFAKMRHEAVKKLRESFDKNSAEKEKEIADITAGRETASSKEPSANEKINKTPEEFTMHPGI